MAKNKDYLEKITLSFIDKNSVGGQEIIQGFRLNSHRRVPYLGYDYTLSNHHL